MATKTKHISQWNTAGVGGVLVGAPLAAGEIDAHRFNNTARGHDRAAEFWRNDAHKKKWAQSDSAPGPKFGQTTSTGYEASHDPGDANHHRKMAETYRGWAGKHGTSYPYVTNKLRHEASQRAYEHDKAAGGGRSSGGSSGGGWDHEDFWSRTYDRARRADGGRSYSGGGSGGYAGSESHARTHEWKAASARRAAGEARIVGRIGAGVGLGVTGLYGAAVMHNNKKWREEQHRRNKGKFATTGAVKKSMDDDYIAKDFREEAHRRARDGRFQAGAAGAAGAALAGNALVNNPSGAHRAAAERLTAESAGHRDASNAYRDQAAATRAKSNKVFTTVGRSRINAEKAKKLHETADEQFIQMKAKRRLAGGRMQLAEEASHKGKVAAGLWLGAGAAGAGAALYNHHRQQKLVSDLQENTVTKNDLNADDIFAKARQMEHSHWAGAKHGAKVGAKVGAVLNGVSGAAMGAGMGAATHGASGAAAGTLAGGTVGAASGAIQGGAVGGLIGAAVGKDVPKKRAVKKNLEISVDDVFAAARGDEVSKALWNDVAEGAGKIGGKIGSGAKAAGTNIGAKATNGFKIAKPKVAAAGTSVKTQWNGLGGRTQLAAVGGGAAIGGYTAGRNKNKY